MKTISLMKRNHLILMAIALILGMAFLGCKKQEPEILTPKITNDKVEVTSTTATFTWTVDWPGKLISVVEVSENEDMSHSQTYGSETETENPNFMVTVLDLKEATKYYYRHIVWNKYYVDNRFVMEVKSFTTETDLPKVKVLEVTDITRTSALGQGEILSDGGLEITERGICWGTSHNPTTSGSHAVSSQNTTTFSVLMTDLTPEETYYVRAYAKNAKGTAYSENEMWFVTGDAVPPTVTTAQVTYISWRTATGGGEVTDDGDAMVTERGLCWSTGENPTIEDSHIESGSGTGSFTADITGLTAGTTYHVRAYAKNRAGYGYGNDVSFNTTDAVVPTATTATPTDITRTSAVCGGEVTEDGGSEITERGVCWGTDSNLSINGNHQAAAENGTGSFTVQITGLTPNTSYYVCSYATNSAGISYGTLKSFATAPIGKPTVTTTQVTNIAQTTATGGGNVTDDGGAEVTERGICWSTEHNPTLETCIGNTHSGTGTGEYTLNMTGLTHGTKYYVRAYAKNNIDTGYGDEVSFTTLADAPTVITGEVTNISMTSATASGNVTADGGAEVIERGVCWSTSHNPTINGNHVSAGSGIGLFAVNITGLTLGTDYYLKAYAKNSAGINYGEEVHFTTELTWPNGTLPGYFTINENGDKVCFSQGNLQYQASNNKWQFAEKQWDYIGSSNQNISSTYSGWIDLFGWGTSGLANGAICYQPWSTSTTDSQYNPYGSLTTNLYDGDGRADWGYNAISNGGNQINMWRTLTKDEFVYMVNHNPNNYPIRYAFAIVNGIEGVILVPDDWTNSVYSFNVGGVYEYNIISEHVWYSLLEPAGAVFLPAGGTRNGTTVNLNSNEGPCGHYWLSTHEIDNVHNNYNAYYFPIDQRSGSSYFNGGGHTFRKFGHSVRLVRDVN